MAATEAEIVELPKEAFEASLKREPELLDRLVDLMERRDSQTTEVPLPKEGRRSQWARQVRAWFSLG